jgi:hypothetical protein
MPFAGENLVFCEEVFSPIRPYAGTPIQRFSLVAGSPRCRVLFKFFSATTKAGATYTFDDDLPGLS